MSQSDFVTRGQALVSSGQYQEAVKVCRLGLLGRPTTVEGRVVLGTALLALKRFDEVLAEMRVALELDHTSVTAQVLKGEALLRKGDGVGALEVLGKLRSEGLGDSHVAQLIGEAERIVGRAPPSSISPIALPPEPGTKHYPAADPSPDGGDDPDAPEDTGNEFTRPTSLAAPSARKRPPPPFGNQIPPAAVLAVGDRSGTVEVDPDREGIELRPSEEDIGDLVAPPVSRQLSAQIPAVSATMPSPRQTGRRSVPMPAQRAPRPSATVPAPRMTAPRAAAKQEVSTVELDDDQVVEVDETIDGKVAAVRNTAASAAQRRPSRGTEVRNAVRMPSGPIDLVPEPPPRAPALPPPQPAAPPHLAALIASQPHVMAVQPISQRSQIAAALPTAAAMPMPAPIESQTSTARGVPPAPPMAMGMPVSPMAQTMVPQQIPVMPMLPQQIPVMPMGGPQAMPIAPPPAALPGLPPMQPQVLQPVAPQLPPHLQSSLAAARPTVALTPMQEQSAAAVDALFNGNAAESPAWGRATVMPAIGAAGQVPSLVPNAVAPGVPGPPFHSGRAAADERTHLPGEIDPRVAAMVNGAGPGGPGAPGGFPGEPAGDKQMRTGMRKRSKLQIFVWILIGGAVIGGGVFAGFQIRAIRLRKQIAAARDRAVDLANADTWTGWTGARDSLYSIAQASPTVDNRAALARARAVLGYEFGDGAADAKAAVDALATQPIDGLLAAGYVALSQGDGKVARDAAERAKQAAPADPEALADTLYVSGEALLLAGDIKGSIDEHKKALEKAPRPLYAVGLARALGAASAWDDALAVLDGRGTPAGSDGKYNDNPAAIIARADIMAGAGRVVGQPAADLRNQLAKVIAEGGKPAADQPRGVSPLQIALADLALAQVDFARGDAQAAHADYLASLQLHVDDQRYVEALAETVFAIGDLEAARKIATRAAKLFPSSRRIPTTLAQVWIALGKPNAALDLLAKSADAAAWPKGHTVRGLAHQAIGDTDSARADFDAALKKLPGYEPALIARTWIDLAAGEIDEAKKRLEPRFNPRSSTAGMLAAYAEIQRLGGDAAARDKAKALLEHAVVGPGADAGKVQLELARIDRDAGDMPGAKTAYAAACRTGNFEARLEAAQLQLDDSDPANGRAMLEQLLKDSGDHPPAMLLIETARARTLMGAHAGAAELLALAEKTPNVVAWQLDRERARLALRKADPAGAAQALFRALESCGGDLDTFLLAADTIATDEKQAQLAQKLTSLVPARLKGKPEVEIVAGKLALAANKLDDAEKVYTAARDALDKDKATPRRRAQAAFGLAAVAYFKRDDPAAKSMFELVMAQDPSIFGAYLFASELARPKAPEDALRYAQQAAALNPDSLDAWKLVGTLASQLKKPALLKDAVTRVGDLAPGSETLHQLQSLH